MVSRPTAAAAWGRDHGEVASSIDDEASRRARVGLGGLADRFGRRRVALIAFVAYALVVGLMAHLRPGLLFVFGLGFATVLTLVVTPAALMGIENLADKRRNWAARFRQWRGRPAHA